MMCTELGPDARILAINSMFTKMGRMDFHDGSLSKEVSEQSPALRTPFTRGTQQDMPKLCPLKWQILASNLNMFYCESRYFLKKIFFKNHSAANSPLLQRHFL